MRGGTVQRLNSHTVIAGLLCFLPLCVIAYLAIGPSLISPLALFGEAASDTLAREQMILGAIRLPRAAMAVLVSSRAAHRAQLVNLRVPVGLHYSYLCCSA